MSLQRTGVGLAQQRAYNSYCFQLSKGIVQRCSISTEGLKRRSYKKRDVETCSSKEMGQREDIYFMLIVTGNHHTLQNDVLAIRHFKHSNSHSSFRKTPNLRKEIILNLRPSHCPNNPGLISQNPYRSPGRQANSLSLSHAILFTAFENRRV